MSKVLKVDCSSGACWVKKSLTTVTGDYYVELGVYVPSSTMTALNSSNFSADWVELGTSPNDGIFLTGFDTSGGSHPFSSGNRNYWTDFTSANPVSAGFTSNAWHTIKVKRVSGLYTWTVDATDVFSYTHSFSFNMLWVGGIFPAVVSGEIYYMRDVKVGTTLGGTDIFADDFSSGGISAWTTHFGTPSPVVIDDPTVAVLAADFTGTPTSGVASLNVAFTDTSTPGPSGPITAWSWDFGDGGTSSSQNPSHTYTSPGTYTVVLQITGTSPDGTDTKTRVDYITVGTAPTNIDQASALNLSPRLCSSGSFSNQFAPDTAAVDDPLNTVYGLGGTFSRQVWFKLTNTASVQTYAQFTITPSSSVEWAAAVYLDDPATYPVDSARTNDQTSVWTGRPSDIVGTAIEPGQTVWIEVAGDDTSPPGLDGSFLLEWDLLAATFYDAPDYYAATDFAPTTGGTNFRGGLQAPEYASLIDTLSYAKVGNQHFWALSDNNGGGAGTFLSVWVWTDGGGAPTIYHIDDPSGAIALGSGGTFWGFGINRPLLRTDGTNLWLVAYTSRTENSPSLCPGTYTAHELVVFLWNGSGFTFLGSETTEFFPLPGVGNYFQVVGDFSAAADATDVGYLHVVWCEAGPNTCTQNVDSHPATMGSRISYSKWDTSGLVLQNDVVGTSITTPAGTLPRIAGTCLSAYIAITNAYGNPVLFHAPCVDYDPVFTGGVGTIAYDSILNMYAIDGSGVATLQQSYDITSDFPTQTFDDVVAETTLGVTQRSPQRQLYGDDQFLIWALRTPSHSSLHLVVPADGSSAITLLSLSALGNFMEAIVDNDNIWAGAGWSGDSGLGIVLGNASLSCLGSGDTFNPSISPKLVSATGLGGGVSEFFWDDIADCFYTMGWNGSAHPSEEYAPIQIPILRDYLICTIGTCVRSGLHVWQTS